jgi:putative chitobiose transport system permease protein
VSLSRSNTAPWLLLGLPCLSLLLVFILPFGQALQMSGLDFTHQLYDPRFVGIGNYLSVLSSPDFTQALWNTLILLFYILPTVLVTSTGMALLFAGRFRGVSLLRVLVYLPVVVSMVVAGMLWKWVLAGEGLLNSGLSALSLPSIPWLSSPHWVLPAIALVVVWKASAYYMMMLITRLESIPKMMYESARLDGANAWQQFLYLTLPQLKGMLALVTMICTLGSLKIFSEVYILTGGGPIGASKTLIFYIYERAFQRLDLGVATAAGILFAGLIVLLTLMQTFIKKRISSDITPVAPSLKKIESTP